MNATKQTPNEATYSVYVNHNLEHGNFYVGRTRTENRPFVKQSARNRLWPKYAGDSFNVTIIASGLSYSEASALETATIIELRSFGQAQANISTGSGLSGIKQTSQQIQNRSKNIQISKKANQAERSKKIWANYKRDNPLKPSLKATKLAA